MTGSLPNPHCFLCEKEAEHYTDTNGHCVYRCPQCRLLFLHPLPTSAVTEGVYTEAYFSGAGYTDYERDKEPMRRSFQRYLSLLEKDNLSHEKTLLDVGASTGFFMQLAKESGWTVSGIEISPYAVRVAQEAGRNVKKGTLETIPFPDEAFGAISLFDVFEHFLDPEGSLRTCLRILKPGGVLCINTPTSHSLWARFWGRKWQAILPPEHTFLFNEDNLAALLERCGFTVVLTTKVSKWFTIPYIFQMLFRWRKNRIFHWCAVLTSGRLIGSIAIPLNVRDNAFLIARKPAGNSSVHS